MDNSLVLASKIFHNQPSDNKVTSPYGMRKHPITGVLKLHSGIDFSTKLEKWKQYSISEGYVHNCGRDKAGANAIFAWVAYPKYDFMLLHYHLDSLSVKKGQTVDENTVIGATGTTGNSTGIHLHLGAKRISTGAYFDPSTIDLSNINVKTKKRYLYLDKKIASWNVYPLNKDARVGNEIGKLEPKKFGGLKYEILDELGGGVYVIETQTFGKVKIYAGNDTASKIK